MTQHWWSVFSSTQAQSSSSGFAIPSAYSSIAFWIQYGCGSFKNRCLPHLAATSNGRGKGSLGKEVLLLPHLPRHAMKVLSRCPIRSYWLSPVSTLESSYWPKAMSMTGLEYDLSPSTGCMNTQIKSENGSWASRQPGCLMQPWTLISYWKSLII